MNNNWKNVATMLTHFMYVADMNVTPEEHGTQFCTVCQEARDAYAKALMDEQ